VGSILLLPTRFGARFIYNIADDRHISWGQDHGECGHTERYQLIAFSFSFFLFVLLLFFFFSLFLFYSTFILYVYIIISPSLLSDLNPPGSNDPRGR
jgi:hypothetical protein